MCVCIQSDIALPRPTCWCRLWCDQYFLLYASCVYIAAANTYMQCISIDRCRLQHMQCFYCLDGSIGLIYINAYTHLISSLGNRHLGIKCLGVNSSIPRVITCTLATTVGKKQLKHLGNMTKKNVQNLGTCPKFPDPSPLTLLGNTKVWEHFTF